MTTETEDLNINPKNNQEPPSLEVIEAMALADVLQEESLQANLEATKERIRRERSIGKTQTLDAEVVGLQAPEKGSGDPRYKQLYYDSEKPKTVDDTTQQLLNILVAKERAAEVDTGSFQKVFKMMMNQMQQSDSDKRNEVDHSISNWVRNRPTWEPYSFKGETAIIDALVSEIAAIDYGFPFFTYATGPEARKNDLLVLLESERLKLKLRKEEKELTHV